MKFPNPPLVETIFEIRWQLAQIDPPRDSNYKLLVGQLFDAIKNEYGYHEQLPAASIPDEMYAFGVQHRFRVAKNEWPLVQIGPGILTLNETTGYEWEDFKNRANTLVKILFQIYPDAAKSLKVSQMKLHYIDAIAIDFNKLKILDFLRQKLKINIELPVNLFESGNVIADPSGLFIQFSHISTKPRGVVHIKFARGKKNGEDALIWETIIQSISDDVPHMPEGNLLWLDGAHDITHDWFSKLTKGELEKEFV